MISFDSLVSAKNKVTQCPQWRVSVFSRWLIVMYTYTPAYRLPPGVVWSDVRPQLAAASIRHRYTMHCRSTVAGSDLHSHTIHSPLQPSRLAPIQQRTSTLKMQDCTTTAPFCWTDWLNCGFTSHSTQNRSFRRRLPKPIFSLGMEKTKPNTTKAHCHQSKENVLNTKTKARFSRPFTTSGLETGRVYSQRKR